MKKQILHISKLQTAKVIAVLYFVTSLPFFVLMLMLGHGSMSLFLLISMPVLYALFGFLGTLLAAWIYNAVAARIGGIEFTSAEVA